VRLAVRVAPANAGFTLVEMMIAMTIGLFLLVGMASLTASHSLSSKELEKTSRQIESARYAMQVIGDDVTLAGFYGTFMPKGAAIATPDPCATSVGNLGFDSTTTPITLPAPAYGYVPGAVPPTCLTNVAPNTGIVVVRRASSVAIGVGAAVPGETYLQAAQCNSDPKAFVIDSNTASFTLHLKDCGSLAPIRKYMVRTYYVSSCNVCSGPKADTTPTLKVAELVGGAISITPLSEGIQDLEADYGVDLDNDGAVDCYVGNPGVDNTTTCAAWASAPGWTAGLQNWGNVVTVRLHVLGRNTESSANWVDGRTYDMGLAGTVGPFNDPFKRHAYRAVLRIANVAGMREL
jgi:type IV pilus assembly protein PilW